MNINIECQIDENTKEVYGFWFNNNRNILYLDHYSLRQRKTKRHKYEILQMYRRIDQRNNTVNIEDIEISDDIKKSVMEKFISEITIEKWEKT